MTDKEEMKSESIKEKKVYETEEYLIREALVREIINAERWQTVVAAWEALLKVIRMVEDMNPTDSSGLTSYTYKEGDQFTEVDEAIKKDMRTR